MISQISADRFRTLVDFRLEPTKCCLVYGANGAGKTSVFDVVAAIQDIAGQGLSVADVLDSDSFTAWADRDAPLQKLSLDARIDGERYRYVLVVAHDLRRGTVRIATETLQAGRTVLYEVAAGNAKVRRVDGKVITYPATAHRSQLPDLFEVERYDAASAFVQYLRNLWVLKLEPWTAETSTRKEAEWLERNGSNFPSWLRRIRLSDSELFGQWNSDMERVLEGYRGSSFEGKAVRELMVSLASPSPKRSRALATYELPFDALTLGQRQIMMLYAALRAAERAATLLCLDEPDNFVSLRELQPWLQALELATNASGTQVIVASHHPEVIDYLAANSAFLIERSEGGRSSSRKIELDRSTTAGMKLSELIERGWDRNEADG